MALASPRQPVQQLTPPSSSHGGQGSWDFAVPVNNAKGSYATQQPLMSEDVHAPQLYPPRQPLTSQPNGFTKPAHFDGQDSQRQYYEDEPTYLVPSRVSDLHRKPSGDLSASNSDPDSVLEYYKGPDGKNGTRSRSASQAASVRNKKKGVKPENWEQLEQDHNNWIHRDKLKEIEIREMEEAGFRVGRSSRSNSRSQNAGWRKRDRKNSELTDPMSNNEDDDPPPRKRVVSTIAAADEEEDNEQLNWDLRTPEEIAADNEQWAIRHNNNNNHNIRPSTSRIPVAKMSPVPVPHTYVERDVPLPRSRKGSAQWTGDALAMNGARVRSGSVSSQVLMDDADATEDFAQSPLQRNFSNPVSPVNRSPQKAKTPAKPLPASGARKTSTTLKAPAKPRNVSGPSPKRPGTSGGSVSRPTTSHRPEGEAPWIATMYKPDPRLPPDQQIIPTHAKRIQQEQWESQGRVGSMYDTDFRLLNTEDFPDKRLSQINPIELEEERERQEKEKQWPLPTSSPTKKHMPERIDTNLRSPTNEQGSYKLTPTIPQSPRVASRSSNHRTAPSISPSKPKNTTRLPEPVQENEKEKKGCCCIVM